MDIERSLKLFDFNWGAFKDIEIKFKKEEIDFEWARIRILRYPDEIGYDSIEDACRDVREKGPPKTFHIIIHGKYKSEETFSMRIHRGNYSFSLYMSGIDGLSPLNSIMEFLGLEPAEPLLLPPSPKRTAFIAHRFDPKGSELADKLARFMELLNFKVVTGRSYSPKSVADKVRERIETQALLFIIITPGEDDTWLTQESILGSIKGKPLIILKDKSTDFKSGILSDHEYISFLSPHIESTFIPILEGLRELGYELF